MSEDGLHVDTVRVERAPGFATGGFTVEELSAGVTIVHGPNACGKSTLCRSIQELLWPGEVEPRSELVGTFALNGTDWRVETRRGSAEHQQDGQPANPPPLPAAEDRDRYRLGLDELLDTETRNESFAAAIERESAGGFDVPAAADALGFEDGIRTRGIDEVSAVESALESVREARRDAEELRDEERRLTSLEAELEAAREAQHREEILKLAIGHAEAREEAATAEADLDSFPDVLGDLDGDEAATVEELSAEIESLREERTAAEETLADAEERLEDTGLPEGGIDTGTLTELKERQDRLEELERDRETLQGQVESARKRRAEALEDIPAAVDSESLADLEPAAWESLDEYARTAIAVREDRATLDALERWFDDRETPSSDLETLEHGQEALEGWLKAPAGDGQPAALRIAIAAALALTVAGVALAVTVDPLVLSLFVLAGAGLIGWGYLASESGGASHDTDRQEDFEALDLAPPDRWEPAAVRQRLAELHTELAAHEVAEGLAEQRRTLAGDIEALEQREATLEETRDRLREQLGLEPGVEDLELLATARGILRWQDQDDELQGHRAELDELEARIDEVRSTLADELAAYGYDEVPDAATAAAHVRELEERATEHEEARRDREQAAATIDETAEAIEDCEAQRRAVYEAAALEPGELDRLEELCDQVEAYEEAVTAVQEARAVRENKREDLEDHPEAESALLDRSVTDLEAERQEVSEDAQRVDELQSEIGQIEGRIQEAKSGRDLETALAEKRRALRELARQREADMATLVGHTLAERVHEATTEATRPAVFQRARELLTRITAGRYRLLLDDEGTFRALDTVEDRGYALDELSSATRLQVLLAVRVAFVETQEQGVKLPLLLDETLANSDDERAQVIIDAMLELARDGRQICYFTAQGDEVVKWEAALEAADDVPSEVVDLAAVQGRDDGVSVPDGVETWTSPSVPAPEDRDHAAYGEALDVEPFDPRNGVAGTHLWYLVDEPGVLFELLSSGITHWGQLEALLDDLDPAVVGADSAWEAHVRQEASALAAYIDAWSRGRGKPVTRDVLDASGAVSENFIEAVTDLAEELDGDGEALVAALERGEVNRFRSDKTAELREYLEAEGHIVETEPLAEAEIRLAVKNSYVQAGVAAAAAEDRVDALLERLSRSSIE